MTVVAGEHPLRLEDYSHCDGALLTISARQGSYFAKQVAGDFNPIHDEHAKRFCVPGDLLFALAVSRYGVRERMDFNFAGMVGDGVGLRFPERVDEEGAVTNDQGKPLLHMHCAGSARHEPGFCEALIREYVAFSGQNFPHILVPLLARHGVMINPDRPLVIYESMSLSFADLNASAPRLALRDARLDVSGKRGEVQLAFDIEGGAGKVGEGSKKLAIGGLQPYDEARMEALVAAFLVRKAGWKPD